MDGEGAGKDPGTVPGGDAAAGAAGGAGGSGGEDKPGAAGGAGGSEFDRGKLHPALRDMKPEEITELFETMATSLRTVQSRAAAREDVSGVPAHARPPEPPKPPEPIAKETYKKLLDPTSEEFDPETAFKAFAERNYGQLFGDVNLRSIKGMYGQFRDQLPDFKEFETEITHALSQTGKPAAQITEQDVLSTYFGVKGMKMTLKERQASAGKAATTLPPSPIKQVEKSADLSDVELEVADRMFRRIPLKEDRIKKYKEFAKFDEGGMTMKVPVGGGKVE